MQGMMLAERPADSSMSSGIGVGGGGGGGSVPSVSIGNYKGVMLCNRPFAGVAAAARANEDGGGMRSAFITGKPTEKIGANVPIGNGNAHVVVRRSKKDTVLSRHKKWLNDLQKTKDRLELEYLEEMEAKEVRHKRFMKRESKMRAMVRGTLGPSRRAGGGGGNNEEDKDDDAEYEDDDDLAFEMEMAAGGDEGEPELDNDFIEREAARSAGGGDNDEAAQAKPQKRAVAKGAKGAKPMWALTEAAAENEVERRDDEEAEDLLDFAKGLDFDKYIDDMEVKAMIDRVKTRIDELESEGPEEDENEEGKDGDDDAAAEAKGGDGGDDVAEGKSGMKLTTENLEKMQRADGTKGGDDELDFDAKSMLSEGGRSLRSVHSEKSISAIAARARAKLEEQKKDRLAVIAEVPIPKPNPKIVVHAEDEGVRMDDRAKNTVSNLPYMHRNPAV